MTGLAQHWRNLSLKATMPQACLLLGVPDGAAIVNEFARWLFCQQACGKCNACHLLQVDNHPDFIRCQADELTNIISIDKVRKIIDLTKQRPQLAEKIIVVINNVDTMTVQAANAFLKTLEEPVGEVLFFLIATTRAKERLLPTLVSRCQIFYGGVAHSSGTYDCLQQEILNDLHSVWVTKQQSVITIVTKWQEFELEVALYYLWMVVSLLVQCYFIGSRVEREARVQQLLAVVDVDALWGYADALLAARRDIALGRAFNLRLFLENFLGSKR